MTHDKKLLDLPRSFSPMSLQETEKPVQLDITLEKVVLLEGKELLSAFLEENHARLQSDKTGSSALKKSAPSVWIFGLMHSTPRV